MATTPTPPANWPRLLSLADYARACSQATGKTITRQAISQRIESGTLTPEPATEFGGRTRYIDTVKFPPGPAPGRWPQHRKPATP